MNITKTKNKKGNNSVWETCCMKEVCNVFPEGKRVVLEHTEDWSNISQKKSLGQVTKGFERLWKVCRG
jgi:hypothetical protein